MRNSDISIYPPGGNTIQGIWRPIANSNLLNKAGYLLKLVGSATILGETQATVDLPAAVTDTVTDLMLDDGANINDTTNQGKFITAVPIDALDQLRVYTTSTGNAGDLMVLSATLGQLQKASSSATGTYPRVFQAIENYVPGQLVLVRRYPGSYTH